MPNNELGRIPARPTVYKGIRMRSRLEARAAAMLDDAGHPWLYEPMCFADQGGQYLPDFVVPCLAHGFVPHEDPTGQSPMDNWCHNVYIDVKPGGRLIDIAKANGDAPECWAFHRILATDRFCTFILWDPEADVALMTYGIVGYTEWLLIKGWIRAHLRAPAFVRTQDVSDEVAHWIQSGR